MSKNDEFCIKNEELCIENEELCIQNEELCIKNDTFCRSKGVWKVGRILNDHTKGLLGEELHFGEERCAFLMKVMNFVL